MTNHPGRKTGAALPDEFRHALAQARARAGLTQTAAGKLISAALRTWQQWEAGDRPIPVNASELWCIAAVADGLLPPSDPFVRITVRPSILSLARSA